MSPYSLQFLAGGGGEELGQDLPWLGAKLFTISRLLNVHRVRAHVQDQGCPRISPFPSRFLPGWLSHFLSRCSRPWKGFEAWSVFDVFFWPCQSLPGRQQALSSLCKWVFKSVCLPSCCVSSLSLWCPSSIVPCNLTHCLACSKLSLPLPWYGNLHGKYFWNSPLPIASLFPSSCSISFPLPSTIQTFARCGENSIHWNKTNKEKQEEIRMWFL